MKMHVIKENCDKCDSCCNKFETLSAIVIDLRRGCICSKCADAFINQELMSSKAISMYEHYLQTIREDD